MKKSIALLSVALVSLFLASVGYCAPAGAPELDWQREFERICAQTEIAASLPAEQLDQLISDSDALLDRLSRIKDPRGKIYVFRLKNCREFFAYALQIQQRDG